MSVSVSNKVGADEETYSEFKKNFYSRVQDIKVFDCEEFNLLKVVLDGLKVKYHKRPAIRGRLEIFSANFFIINNLRRLKKRRDYLTLLQKIKLFSNVSVLVGFDRRSFVEKGKRRSMYFSKIIETLGTENILFCTNRRDWGINIDCDIYVEAIESIFCFLTRSVMAKRMRAELLIAAERIENLGIFNEHEMFDIKYAIQKFFYEYLCWDFVLSKLKLNSAVIVAHYHREGFILACKRRQVKVIELQHGLIAPEDIFYVFPSKIREIASKALFADVMLVYGEYWQNLLLTGYEYEKKQLKIIGYYNADLESFSAEEVELVEKILHNKTSILVTTQTFIHGFFCDYVLSLLPKLKDDQVIIVKPHPSEDLTHYNVLQNLKNVYVLFCNVHLLLKSCSANVTVYSTTIFDGLRYNKRSYCLPHPLYTDYVDFILGLGIASELRLDENPFDKISFGQNDLPENCKDYYYRDYTPEVLLMEAGVKQS